MPRKTYPSTSIPTTMSSKTKQKADQASTFLTPEEKEEFEGYEFPFENLAFEGGGSKGVAYVGVVRVLEELGILKNIKRFAGTSIGSIVATYLAVGFDSNELQKLVDAKLTQYIYDGKGGIFGRILSLYRKMGAHPGNSLENWLRDNIKQKTGDKNFTFKQLYKERGIELCTMAVNLNLKDAVYLHTKTIPDMPIYLAARASASVPAVTKPVIFNGDVFVDGGLLCNYPVHAYDGWYLSMEPEDSFFARFGDLAEVGNKWDPVERFQTFNEKTFGVMLFSTCEQNTMKTALDDRFAKYSKEAIVTPDTKLSRKKSTTNNKTKSVDDVKRALGRLMATLKDADINKNGSISRDVFRAALTKNALSADDVMVLFGCDNDPDAMFDVMDSNKDGEINYVDFVQQAAKRGVDLLQTFRGYERCEINGVKNLVSGLAETLLLNVKRITNKGCDFSRTIGINTKYLGSFDWNMEKADKDFLMQCGKHATLCFLREYIATKNPPRRMFWRVRPQPRRTCWQT